MGATLEYRNLRLLLAGALAAGCATHQADTISPGSIATVRVTTNIGDVRDCRVIRHVDSRDTSLGCGPTASASAEECLQYQVRRAGGDTLLLRGPAGEAYDCGRGESSATVAPFHPTATPVPPAAARVPEPSAASPPTTALPASESSVRATADRSSARGCVYLGDVEWTAACGNQGDAASGPCAEEARKLAGNLVVREGARAEVFWCRPTP